MAMTQDQFRKLMGLNKPEPLTGAVATGLNYLKQPLDQYALDSRVPLVGGMTAADFTGITGTQGLVQDFSRGKNIQGDMRMFDALGLVPAIAPAMKLTGKATSALGREALRQIDAGTGVGRYVPDMNQYIVPVGKVARPLTKYEEAFDVAQRNASLPVSQGGLGLPANNTAMDRARAMGYDTPAYHGTDDDFNIFNVEGKGKTSGGGAFVTDNPLVAETYVGGVGSGGKIMPLLIRKDNLLDVNARGRNWADITTEQLSAKSKGKRYSLDDLGLDRYSATSTDELAQIAPELGLKGVNIKNVKDLGPNSHIFRAKEYLASKYGIAPDETWSNVTGNQFVESRDFMDKLYKSQKSNVTALQDPSDIRSINAAFDPFRRNEADILGYATPEMIGLLSAGSVGGVAYANNKKKKKTKK